MSDSKNKLSNLSTLTGTIERITFHNTETGFCVVKVKAHGLKRIVTLTGTIPTIHAGESIEAVGDFTVHAKHGQQFVSTQIKVLPPQKIEGIKKYLSSGLIRGVGPHFAKKLVDTFGTAVFDVIENHPDRLLTLSGVGKKRCIQIRAAFQAQRKMAQIMIFLQSYGLGPLRAIRVYKTYGEATIDKIKENPYRLSQDIYGIGFKLTDELAQKLGVAQNALIRIRAGIHHVIDMLTEKGHCGVSYQQLMQQTEHILQVDSSLITQAVQLEIKAKQLLKANITSKTCIFPTSLYQAEFGIAKCLKRLCVGKPPWLDINASAAISWVESKMAFQLSASQRKAIEIVLQNKISIITGGPGVGKTTVVASLLKIVKAKNMRVMLAAPTGRAAKRLFETTGCIAKTIHRLLEYVPQRHRFKHNAFNPLPVDLLVVDEASMLDVPLMHQLISALPSSAACVLIGDVDQLPSVGPGAVLSNLIDSQKIATIVLSEIFRQKATSHIVLNAHRIQQGQMPENIPPNTNACVDFYWIPMDAIADIQKTIITLASHRIPRRFGLHPVEDIQVLTPMHRSDLGTFTLNTLLQKALNDTSVDKCQSFGYTFAKGDKVIQLRNNYDKNVFNGDLGIIQSVDLSKEIIQIQFDDRIIPYEISELNEISLAYALSIHKSQGSEYPAVIIPMVTQHYTMLARNLLYTAVTRGKRLVILVGQMKAVQIAVQTAHVEQRITKLKEWMKC